MVHNDQRWSKRWHGEHNYALLQWIYVCLQVRSQPGVYQLQYDRNVCVKVFSPMRCLYEIQHDTATESAIINVEAEVKYSIWYDQFYDGVAIVRF